jgi:hypothetical protein
MKAHSAVPAVDRESKKPNKSAIAVFLVGALTLATLRRKRPGDDAGSLDG